LGRHLRNVVVAGELRNGFVFPMNTVTSGNLQSASRPASSGREAPQALVITELYPPDVGGSAVLFQEIYRRVPGRVQVLTHVRAGAAEPDGGTEIVARPIATRRWGFVDPRATAHHLRVARELRRLSKGRRTIVHCGRALPEGVAALIHRRLGGAPYICWTHGEDLASASTSRELSFLVRRVYGGASVALANSRNTAAMLTSAGVAPDRIVIVYPGVDTDRFTPQAPIGLIRERFAVPRGKMLLSVGRLQRRKGHDLAIQAVAQLVTTEPHLHYVIVGNGEERSRLERMARDCGIADRVHFAGEVSTEALPSYYAACDVFLLPNRVDNGDIEGFGIVFLEAASTGKPVIAGDSGGVPEAVADGTTGLLVSGTDVAQLSRVLGQVLDDTVLRARLGKAGRERVLKSFTWQRAADMVWAAHERVALETQVS
jgi:phosphatidylinositol alpha-1,6-mannosyltransferase